MEATELEPSQRDFYTINLIKAALAKPTHVVELHLKTWFEHNFTIRSQRNIKKAGNDGEAATASQGYNTQSTQDTQRRKTSNYGQKSSGKGYIYIYI